MSLIVVFAVVSKLQHNDYQDKIRQKDEIILFYEQTLIPLYDQIDSIEVLRNENDTATYNFSSDSLERYFTERFGHIITGSSQ